MNGFEQTLIMGHLACTKMYIQANCLNLFGNTMKSCPVNFRAMNIYSEEEQVSSKSQLKVLAASHLKW